MIDGVQKGVNDGGPRIRRNFVKLEHTHVFKFHPSLPKAPLFLDPDIEWK
jgi:hypothetical protein